MTSLGYTSVSIIPSMQNFGRDLVAQANRAAQHAGGPLGTHLGQSISGSILSGLRGSASAQTGVLSRAIGSRSGTQAATGFTSGLSSASAAQGGAVRSVGSNMGGLLVAGLTAATGIAAGLGIGALVGKGISAGIDGASNIEQVGVGLTTLLKSSSQAQKMIGDIQKAAASTPFSFESLAQGAQRLAGVGLKAKAIIPTLLNLGDTVAATGGSQANFDSALNAMSQSMSAGTVNAGDLLQITQAGIPIWKEAAAAYHTTVPKMKELVATGKVKSDVFWSKTQAQTAKDFGGAMTKMSGTVSGVMSNLGDTVQQALVKGVQPMLPLIKTAIPVAGAAFEQVIGKMSTATAGFFKSIKPAQITGIITGLGTLGTSLVTAFAPLGTMFVHGVSSGLAFVNTLLKSGKVASGAGTLVASFSSVMKQVQGTFVRLAPTVGAALSAFVTFAGGIVKSLATSENLKGVLGGIETVVKTLAGAFIAVLPTIQGVVNWLLPFASAILSNKAAVAGILGAFIAWRVALIGIRVASAGIAIVQGIMAGYRIAVQAAAAASYGQAAASYAVGAATKAQMVGLIAFKVQTIAMSIAQKVAAAGQWLLNAAMSANPIAIVVIAIAALVAGLIWFFTQTKLGQAIWANFTRFLGEAWNNIVTVIGTGVRVVGQAISTAWNAIVTGVRVAWSTVVAVVSMYVNAYRNAIVTVFNVVSGFIRTVWNNLTGFIRTVFTGIVNIIRPPLTIIANIWQTIWGGIVRVFYAIGLVILAVGKLIFTALFNAVRTQVNAILYTWRNIWNAVVAFVRPIWNSIVSLVRTAVNTVLTVVRNVINTVRTVWNTVWNAVSTVARTVWNAIVSVVRAHINTVLSVVRTVINTVRSVWSSVWNTISGVARSVWNTITGVVRNGVNTAHSVISSVLGAIRSAWNSVWNGIANFIRPIWNRIVSGVTTAIGNVVRTVGSIQSKVMGVLSGVGSWLLSVGHNLVQGLVNGITNNAKAVLNAIGGVVEGAIKWAKGILGIHSPSRVFHQIGVYVGKGLVNGVNSTSDQVKTSMTNLKDKIVSAFDTLADQKTAAQKRIRSLDAQLDGLNKKSKGYASRRKSILAQLSDQKAIVNYANKVSNHGKTEKNLLARVASTNKTLAGLVKSRDSLAKSLATATDKLNTAKGVRNDFAANVKSSVINLGDVAQAFSNAVQAGRTGSVKDMVANLSNTISATKDFTAALATLRKQGLDDTTYQQLISAGVAGGGLDAANALLAGGPGAVSEIAGLQKQLTSAAGSLGTATSRSLYQAGVDAAQGLVDGLKKQEKTITDQMTKISNSLVTAIKKALGIHSPSRVLAEVGMNTGRGMALGLQRSASLVSRASDALLPNVPASYNPNTAVSPMVAGSNGGGFNQTLNFNGQMGYSRDEVADSIASKSRRSVVAYRIPKVGVA